MECYRCAANQVLTYLSLIFSSRIESAMQLGDVGWSQLKNKSCHHHCQVKMSMVAVHYQMKARRRGGKRSMKSFSLFIARCDSISFCFTSRSPLYFFNNAGTCTLNQGSSVHFSRNRKWKVFHSERGFRSDTSLLLDSNVQNTMFEKNYGSYVLGPSMTSVTYDWTICVWGFVRSVEAIRGQLRPVEATEVNLKPFHDLRLLRSFEATWDHLKP